MSATDRVERARELYQQGDTEAARAILLDVLRQNRDDAQAWAAMAQIVDSVEEQVRCWEEVLRILPGNSFAQKQIDSLQTAGMQTESLFTGPSPYDPPPFSPPQFNAQAAINQQTKQIEDQFHDMEDEFHKLEDNITRLSTVIKDLEEYERVEDAKERRRQTGILPIVLFLGTLMGSLLGATADFGETVDTFNQFRSVTYPKLCIVGSNTILGEGLGMAEDWAVAFEEDHNVRVDVQGIGSTAGVQAAADGECANILAMSEPMTRPQENTLRDAGVEITCAAEIGYDVVAFVTHNNNPVDVLLDRQLRSILRGEVDNWSQVFGDEQPIFILAREGSGTTEFVMLNVANYRPTTQQPFPPGALNYNTCDSNDDCLDRTLSTPGSLYWVSVGWLRTQPEEYLSVLPILRRDDDAPINPLVDDIDVTTYPSDLIRPLYLYVLENSGTTDRETELAIDFLRFVRGVQGQQIVEQYGFFNHFINPPDVPVPLPEGFTREPGRTPRICQPG